MKAKFKTIEPGSSVELHLFDDSVGVMLNWDEEHDPHTGMEVSSKQAREIANKLLEFAAHIDMVKTLSA